MAASGGGGESEGRDHRRDGSLDAYRAKRRFARTPEPSGRKSRRQGRLFTMQKHAARRLHYDLRLELDGVLKSWAITRGPSLDPAAKRLAVRTEGHPLDYATFEGTIPKGEYGAGTVLLWDRGTWEPEGDPRAGLAAGRLVFKLRGERLSGQWALVRMRTKKTEKRENWLLLKRADTAAAADRDVTAEHTTSIATGRDMDVIAGSHTPAPAADEAGKPEKAARRDTASSRLPDFVAPQLARLVDTVPEGEGWLFEPKFDGYRAIVAASGNEVRIHTRNGHDWTHRFATVANAVASLDLEGALLDGEITVIDADGRADFGALQRSLEQGGDARHSLFVFDLLAAGGTSLRSLPLVERKARLERLLAEIGRSGRIYYTDHLEGHGAAMGAALHEAGFEGLIAKRADSRYRSGRGRSWLKIKFARRQEFVIVGWSPSSVADRPFASILLGLQEPDGLHYAGRVGTGFGARELQDLARRFTDLSRATSPLAGEAPRAIERDAHWVQPKLVAEVGYAERTREGAVRHGRFLGLRQDKPAAEVEPERPTPGAARGRKAAVKAKMITTGAEDGDTIAGVRLSNPDRVLYPAQGVTKRDLAGYLEVIGDRMLPFVSDRLVSLVRCPEGRAKKCFFQRHGGAAMPDIFKRLPVTHKRGDVAYYLYLDDVQGLVAAAQMGVVELHVWGSRVDDLDKPDRLVFDLDPDPSVGFDRVRVAAAAMRDALEALGLESFALLTGGKGVHVVAPLVRRHDWPTVKAFSRALAEHFVAAEPETYVATMSKARRKNRIFIDHFRNERGSTAIAPYSPRVHQGAPVAWPVTWSELAKAPSAALVDLPQALRHMAGPDPWTGYPDPWTGYKAVRQSITAAARRALGL